MNQQDKTSVYIARQAYQLNFTAQTNISQTSRMVKSDGTFRIEYVKHQNDTISYYIV